MRVSISILLLTIAALHHAMGDKIQKEKSMYPYGLKSMRYFPTLPYGMLGFKPPLTYGTALGPNVGVFKPKEIPEEEKAPYSPYGDMEKTMGYGGLAMPYGGYGYPMLYGYQ